MVSVLFVFLIAAIIVAVAAAMGKAPLYVAVLLLAVVEAIQILPLR